MSVILAASCAGTARAQEPDPSVSGMSRLMQSAVMFYERGEDLEAMDRFMEVLTKGEPSERPMANEYLNLITHRMNVGNKDFQAPAPGVRVESAEARKLPVPRRADSGPAVVIEPDSREKPAAAGAAPKPAAAPVATRSEASMPRADKELMKKEIRAKLRYEQETALKLLRSREELRIVMRENGDPAAIGIPSAALFDSGIAFRKGAVGVLDAMTRLVFAMGAAQVCILPEGAAI
ncbi:MAG: hypothetical protein PHF00_05960, partial [Elusimicrobia bacterium]|nr:hypothetical protein [Elusimicrobiota bacterium]